MKTVHLVGCIKRDVMRWVQRHSGEKIDLSDWYCGVTNMEGYSRVEKFIKKNGNSHLLFRRWLANDLTGSSEVLRFFIKNGMRNNPVKGSPKEDIKFVYVFKVSPKTMDEVLKLLN